MIALALAAAAAAAALSPAEAGQMQQDRHAVLAAAERDLHAAQAAREAAVQAHDADALVALLEPDTNLSSHKFHAQGSEVLAKGWRALFAKRPDLEDVHTPQSLQISDDAQDAVERGLWRERWREPDGPVILTGEYLVVWVRDADGKWRVASEAFAPLHCEGGAYCRD
jgi:ketosteroid isomerase-like protein